MIALGLVLSVVIGLSLGFFGGGGSILTVPLLVYVFGLDAKVSIASSLLIVAAASIFGAVQHWRAGNVRPRTAIVFGGAGVVGAHLGGRASAWIDGGLLLVLFATVMIGTALAMWRGRREVAPGDRSASSRAKLVLQGVVVGGFTGLVGAGGGFLIVPALALWAGLPMQAAVGTSLVVIVFNSLAGFSGYATHVSVDPELVVPVSVAAIAGVFLGARLARLTDPASLRRAFAGFVLAMGGLILVREARLVAETASDALPTTWPQLAFVVLALLIGIVAGRASRGAGAEGVPEFSFRGGEGI